MMTVFFFQLLLPFVMFFFRFPRRQKFWLNAGLMLTAGTVGFLFLERALMLLPLPWNYYLFYIIPYLLILLGALTLFDLSAFTAIYFCVFSFVVQNFAHHLCRFFVDCIIMFCGVDLESTWYFSFAVYTVFYAAVYSIFYLLFLKDGELYESVDISSLSVLAVSGSFIIILIVLGIYIRYMQAELLKNMGIAIVYETYSTILDVFLVCMLLGLFQAGKLRDEAGELERRLQQEGRYYEMAQANMEIINIKCHDLKHQIAALKSMTDSEERRAEIEELQNAVMIYDNYAKTGNDALDCVLTEKGLYCSQKDISFTYMADGEGLGRLRYMDIYALFGNALDNAIENVEKIAQKEKRIISLRVFSRGGFVNIHVENYCETKPEFRGSLPITTKADRENHGYGLRSIRYITEKYGGNFKVSLTENTFVLSILIPEEQ